MLGNAEAQALDAKVKEPKVAAPEAATGAPINAGPAVPHPNDAASISTAEAKLRIADAARERAREAESVAKRDLVFARDLDTQVNQPFVRTRIDPHLNREIDLLWLVLLAGGIGSFLHLAQSYCEYIGNRTLKVQWASWYAFRPFIGAALALVFYGALRGGFLAVASGSNISAAQLNPFGVVSIAALVGMFSRAAAIKLGEVFDTLFQSDKSKTKDTLVPAPPAVSAFGSGAARPPPPAPSPAIVKTANA